jgi:hypothetical protein
MHYSSSGHDQRTKHTNKTNTHPTPVRLFHFDNVGSFQGFTSDTPIVL